jgi:hypothetical protein
MGADGLMLVEKHNAPKALQYFNPAQKWRKR